MTTLATLQSIKVAANRQRRHFDEGALAELRESIQNRGLLHPIVLRAEGPDLVLVAGERRFRAIRDLHELGLPFSHNGTSVPPGQVPYTTLGELSDLEAREAELEENIRRADLTWQERAAADAALAELRALQAAAAGKPAPTTADLAREIYDLPPDLPAGEIGSRGTAVRDNIIVARHLADPEIAKAPTAKEALKILKKRETQQRATSMAATIGKTFSTASHRLLNEDSLAWMAAAPAAQFDIILTDPPYGMGADEFGDSGQGVSAGAHFYKDSYEEWQRIMSVFCPESYRLARESAHAYVFCDLDRFPELRERMSTAGWKVHRTPLIWHNTDGFRAPWPEQGPQRQYELILYAVKGGKKVTAVKSDVLTYAKDKGNIHPAQKPLPLLIDLLRRSAFPGDAVFDPFTGSGSTVVACHELKLACTALEQDVATYGQTALRIKSLSAWDQALI